MNETPKNKPGRWIPRAFWVWLIFFVVIVLMMTVADLAPNTPTKHQYLLQVLIGIVGASLLLSLWLFVRWSCNRRNFRRVLVGSAILATLIAIFYTEEDWRGKRAWENCKRELEAKGAVLDWNKYIPPPVPDDQNFFKASKKIAFSFVHSRNDAEADFYAKQVRIQLGPTESNSFPILDTAKTRPIIVALLTVISPGSSTLESTGNRLVLQFNDPAARSKTGEFIQNTIGRSANGSQGFKFSEFQLSNLTPAQIILHADPLPSVGDLENLIPADTVSNIGHLRVEATGAKGVFQVLLTGVRITAAADYLKWSDQFEPAFDEIREALKRPYAVIPGDYSKPFEQPIPNFVTMRAVAQTLAQRAQCFLLLNRPEAALPELTLMHDVCRILEKPPTGQPETLVEAMINVAITGLYVATVQEGFRLHAWQAPQLAALQAQLAEINLPPWIAAAFQAEQAGTCHSAELTQPSQISMIGLASAKRTIWKKIMNLPTRAIDLAPRGWVYQNMAVCARMIQIQKENVLDTNQNVIPRGAELVAKDNARVLEHNHSPFYLLARIAIPNFTKAMQVCAFNQTLANEAQIACALERCRLAYGGYPPTLDALEPQFIEKLPHDIIGGQPLIYRRIGDGKFLLYSVGWNETDDGGQVALKKDGSEDREKGDWVWKN
jgi:hypothetical protein